jgi:hypothetical protein
MRPVIHARLDHSIRLPRPDLSISLGTPNACAKCRAERKPDWAAAAMDNWYGPRVILRSAQSGAKTTG